MKNKIYSLDNNTSLFIVEELDIDDSKYVLASTCNPEKDIINDDVLFIYKVDINDEDNIVFNEVENDEEIILSKLLNKINENEEK